MGVLDWLAQHLDDSGLVGLLGVGNSAVLALRCNGKLAAAEELARAVMVA
jgi:hypothetical protein